MRYIDGDFEEDFKEGASFIAEFVRDMLHDKLFEMDVQEFRILPEDLKDTAWLNVWKRVQNDLMTSFKHIKTSNINYQFTVYTIIDEVKKIIYNKDIARQGKGDNVFAWIIFYTMTLFVKDDRLKQYRRKPHVKIDKSEDLKKQIFSNIVLGEEYSDQMCNYLGVYETAKLLDMEYIIPIVEISVAVCVWERILLSIENKHTNAYLPKSPEELDTEESRKMFIKAVKAGLMQPLKDGYRWNKSNALLAYFCGRLYCNDILIQDVVTKEWMVERGKTFFPETALTSFFFNKQEQNIKNLGQSRLQIQRAPQGYKDIDQLFDKAAD